MQNKHIIAGAALAVLAACITLPAAAETTSQTLTRIEAETMLLKARERQLEVQANIVGKQNEIAAKQSMTMALNQTQAQTEVVGDPMVRAIEGVGGHLYATLQLHDGSLVDVQQGDTLPGGMQIVSIGPREVVARAGKRRVRLASYAPSTGFNPAYPAVMPLPSHGAVR